MKNKYKLCFTILWLFLLPMGCTMERKKEEKPLDIEDKSVSVPHFNADSAWFFIKTQVDFGPRVPNTPSHLACGNYLVDKLEKYGGEVVVQEFREEAYNGEILYLRNIIGTFYPERSKRILLTAHWDTRPVADKDSIDIEKPIPGANDGGSGVGVILEIARIISLIAPPNAGIDVIFFDGEDYGEPSAYKHDALNYSSKIWWCLGSQHWSKNKHRKNYMAYFGVLLDMVGARDAKFYKEGGSMQFAPKVVQKIWDAGHRLGYGKYFVQSRSPGITDDHVFINRDAKIPTINIVEYDPDSPDSYFADYHHTHRDDMEIISKETLNAVGQTLLHVLYHE